MNKSVLEAIQRDRDALASQLAELDATLATVRRYLGAGTVASAAVPQRRRARPMTAAERKAVSVRMKAYWAAKKKGKGR